MAAAAVVLFVVLALGDIRATSPTSDEPVHLTAGWSYLRTGDYRLNTEHPPLVKKVAALALSADDVWPSDMQAELRNPTTFSALRESWTMALSQPTAQWHFANQFLFGLNEKTLTSRGWTPLTIPSDAALAKSDYVNPTGVIFTRARTTVLLFGVLLAVVVFLWSRELWGWWGAALSAAMFCTDPNFVAHAGLVTTDVGFALFYAAAIWFLWRCVRRFTWYDAALFAVCFAAAQVTKFSAVLLLPVLIVLGLHAFRQWRSVLVLTALAGLASIAFIWATYGFRYSAVADVDRQIAEETSTRVTLQNRELLAPGTFPTGHLRIRNTLEQAAATKALAPLYAGEPPFAHVSAAMKTVRLPLSSRFILFLNEHHLLPEAYLDGISAVALDSAFRNTFLNGEYTDRGFGSYFFWTTLYKLPIPLLVLSIAGIVVAVRCRPAWISFLVWPAVIYLVVASSSAVNIGHRHILPVFPFVYVACGALAQRLMRRQAYAAIAAVLLVVPLFVVLPAAPMWGHHLSYMNELAGGPRNGGAHLVDSNLDWGQDLPALASWLKTNHVVQPITLLYFGNADPQYYGIRYVNPYLGYFARAQLPMDAQKPEGIYAVSANSFNGFWFGPQGRDYWRRYLAEHRARRIGTAGYSIYLYEFPR